MNHGFARQVVNFAIAALSTMVGCSDRGKSSCTDDIAACTTTPATSTSSEAMELTSTAVASTATTGDTSAGADTDGMDGPLTNAEDGATDASSSTAPTGTTGEAAAVCGNGVVKGNGPMPEECDDANDIPDDGCRDCARDRLVFVTSEEYKGGVFGGLDGADQRCRSLAAQAGLPNFAGFKAWLSDSRTSAAERMFHSRGRYVLVNGLVVADSWDALVAGEVQNPINATETSGAKNYIAWTGTNPDGTAIEGADHCGDWKAKNLANKGFWGNTVEVSAQWTLAAADVGQPQGCAGNLALYCFEQE